MSEVVIVGSGPAGLMLGAELALAGVDVAIVERRSTPELVGSRAGGFHARTLEILDQRGIADRFLAEGKTVQAAGFGSTMLDLSDVPSRYPHVLGLWQNHIERILLGWVEELDVPIQRGVEVTGFAQDDDGVDVHAGRGRAAPDAVPGRGRWRAQRDPPGGRHRVRRTGCDPEPPDRRGRGDRGDAGRTSPRRHRHPRAARAGGRADGPGDRDRARARARHRADPGRSQRGADDRLRHRLRDPQPDLDLAVHRRHPAGRRLPRPTGAARRRRRAHPSPGRRAGDQPRCAGCGQPRVEARPGGQGHLTRRLLDTYHVGTTPGRQPAR